jgi:hypothetical protein
MLKGLVEGAPCHCEEGVCWTIDGRKGTRCGDPKEREGAADFGHVGLSHSIPRSQCMLSDKEFNNFRRMLRAYLGCFPHSVLKLTPAGLQSPCPMACILHMEKLLDKLLGGHARR